MNISKKTVFVLLMAILIPKTVTSPYIYSPYVILVSTICLSPQWTLFETCFRCLFLFLFFFQVGWIEGVGKLNLLIAQQLRNDSYELCVMSCFSQDESGKKVPYQQYLVKLDQQDIPSTPVRLFSLQGIVAVILPLMSIVLRQPRQNHTIKIAVCRLNRELMLWVSITIYKK